MFVVWQFSKSVLQLRFSFMTPFSTLEKYFLNYGVKILALYR